MDGNDSVGRNAAGPGLDHVSIRSSGAGRCRIDVHADADLYSSMAADVFRGLTHKPKFLLPKFFYDAPGSALFEQITRLPEYYLTRAEHHILRSAIPDLVRDMAPEDIVEVGSGSGIKVRYVLDAVTGSTRPVRYVPVDINEETVGLAASGLAHDYPFLHVHGIVVDFERHLDRIPPAIGRRLVLFLGSTIGNLAPADRHEVLTQLRRPLRTDDRLLLGLDLVKDRETLEAAYNDAQGLTARFNRNILFVINRGLAADFEPMSYSHHAFYEPKTQRIEMHLIPRLPQIVNLDALELCLPVSPEESIWTESSYKFTRESCTQDLRAAGLKIDQWLTDPAEQVALVLAAPETPSGPM